jgi:glucose-6-phosphate 1-dehydrogenase
VASGVRSSCFIQALDEKKADIRIQFKRPVNTLFEDISPNELVLRVGPDEAVYLKMTTKAPGLEGGNRHTELDLTYKKRFGEEAKDMPEAYERLILDVIRGDHNLFVRADELAAAWRIFTPLLHQIEQQRALKPIKYEFGSRGPPEADELIKKYGYIRTTKYSWEPERDAKKDEAAAKAKL